MKNIIDNYKAHTVATIADLALAYNKKLVLSNGNNISVKLIEYRNGYVVSSICHCGDFVRISMHRMARLHIDKFQEWNDMILVHVSES